jgi:hypothetical protein
MIVGELLNNTKYIPSEIYVGRLENKIIWHNFVNNHLRCCMYPCSGVKRLSAVRGMEENLGG